MKSFFTLFKITVAPESAINYLPALLWFLIVVQYRRVLRLDNSVTTKHVPSYTCIIGQSTSRTSRRSYQSPNITVSSTGENELRAHIRDDRREICHIRRDDLRIRERIEQQFVIYNYIYRFLINSNTKKLFVLRHRFINKLFDE